MSGWMIFWIILLAFVGWVIWVNLPDILRYLKIRSM